MIYPYLCLMLAVGPELDPIEGSSLDARDNALLPSGRHLGQIADVWFVDVVSQQQNGGGIATFDRLALSDHGRSYMQLRYFLNDLEITDPARPGSPLADLPNEAWDRLRFQSLWSSAPGFRFELDGRPSSARGGAGYGGEVGGPGLVPHGVMDREPATGHGAPEDRRALTSAREVTLGAAVGSNEQNALLFAEGVQHAHHYPTLVDSSGAALVDEAERLTVLAGGELELGGVPVRGLALWQQRERSYDRAELRLPASLTSDSHGRAFLGQLAADLHPGPGSTLALKAGVGLRDDALRLHTQTPIVSDIEGGWLWMGRPQPSERARRSRFDASAVLSFGRTADELPLRLAVVGNVASISARQRFPGGCTGTLYGGAADGEEAGVSMTFYDPAQRSEELLGAVRGEAEVRGRLIGFDVRAVGALDFATAGTTQGEGLSFVSPAFGIAATRRFGAGEAFILLRHEPDALTAEVARFLDPAQPSGHRFVWNDDGDGTPEAGEAGRLLARTGGRYHGVRPGVQRPSSGHFALGLRSAPFGPFRAVVTGVGRFAHHRFTVRYSDEVAASFKPTSVADPVDGGSLTVYDRVPGTEGQELYLLTNSRRTDFWIGAEVQLLSVAESFWFMNLGAAGYWSFAGAPIGSFPDRDDPGVIDESAADPNNRVNGYGRPDSDRSFAINLMAGLEPLEGLSAAIALRYRDGQPFTRVLVAEELSQGPTVVMAVPRGTVRHTFHMTLDARMRYELSIGELKGALLVDGFNLLGSGTEILEDPRGADFRESLEMVSGRALFVSLEASWR